MLPTLHSKTTGWTAGAALECKPPEPLITRKDSAHFSPHLSRHAPNSTLKSCPIWLSIPFLLRHYPPRIPRRPHSQSAGEAASLVWRLPLTKRDRKIKWLGATNGPTVLFGLTREHWPELVTAIHLHLAGLAWLAERSRRVEYRGPRARWWKCVRFVEWRPGPGVETVEWW